MKTVAVGNNQYNVNDLDAFTQLHIARKLAPVSMMLERLTADENKGKDPTLLIVLMLGQLSDEDSDQIVKRCLMAVTRNENQGKIRAPIVSPDGQLMYQDISMKVMINLATEVLVENLGDFFRTALDHLNQETKAKSS